MKEFTGFTDHAPLVMGEVPGTVLNIKTDVMKAEDARARLRPVLEEACRILTEVKRDGIVVTFNITTDQYGIYRLMALDVIKPL